MARRMSIYSSAAISISSMIKVENLRVEYHNTGKLALAGVSFGVQKGELAAILGPSGCGKTTLLNVIGGLLSKKEIRSEGSVVFGKNKIRIAMVFQTPNLLPWRNIYGNIAFGLEMQGFPEDVVRQRVEEMISLVRLSGYEKYFPHQLSLGMKQRVNFARAMAVMPDVLVLDEPFASLDKENKARIRESFSRIIREMKMTSIFVTHDKEEAEMLADKIIILSESPAKVAEIRKGDHKAEVL